MIGILIIGLVISAAPEPADLRCGLIRGRRTSIAWTGLSWAGRLRWRRRARGRCQHAAGSRQREVGRKNPGLPEMARLRINRGVGGGGWWP